MSTHRASVERFSINSSNVGIQEWTGNPVSIYPNPLTEGADLILSGLEGDVNISVFDASGRIVWAKKLPRVSSQTSLPDFRDGLSAGIYSIQIQSDKGQLVKKLVVR